MQGLGGGGGGGVEGFSLIIMDKFEGNVVCIILLGCQTNMTF